ncbi:MAG: hypothetical protein IIW62_00410 [Selenomonadales bacterium]|nr:hypothetical protein [Selenomonadales bacterium]
MRARNIKPGFFRDEQLLQVPPLGRLLFAGLWCLADREGRLLERPAQIKWDILPADDCDVNALLAELTMRGFIRRYTADGTRYIEVTRFLAHQRPHYKEKASIIPPPPDTTPAQKHDSTRSDSLIPDSLIPDSLIPSAVSQLDGDRGTIGTALSDVNAVDKTDTPLGLALSRPPSSVKSIKTTDRKANNFFSRQDGNTNRSTPCKQVKHATSWVEGFFGE